jgi:hypothetical protein
MKKKEEIIKGKKKDSPICHSLSPQLH